MTRRALFPVKCFTARHILRADRKRENSSNKRRYEYLRHAFSVVSGYIKIAGNIGATCTERPANSKPGSGTRHTPSTQGARRPFQCLVNPSLPSVASRPKTRHHIAVDSQAHQLLRRFTLRTTLSAPSRQRCGQSCRQHVKRRFRLGEIFLAPRRIILISLCWSLPHSFSVPSNSLAAG